MNRKSRKFTRKNLALLLVIIAIVFLFAFSSLRDQTNALVGTVLFAVGLMILVIAIVRIVLKNNGKSLDKIDSINTQCSLIMRQLNAVKHAIPLIVDKIFDPDTANAGLKEVRALYLENPLERLVLLKEKDPEFIQAYSDYIENALILLNEPAIESNMTRALLRDLKERNDAIFDFALKKRVQYLNQYDR